MKVWRARLESLNACRLFGGGFSKENLRAPGSGCATTHESLAGTLGIPERMPPVRRRIFKGKPACARQRMRYYPRKSGGRAWNP